MSGTSNSGRPSPVYLARAKLDELAEEVARLLENEADPRARCAIELVRAAGKDLAKQLDGARWGPPSHARKPKLSPVPGVSAEEFATIRAEEEALVKGTP